MRAAHPVLVSVEAQQVLIILLLLAAGAGQAVIPRQAPLYAMLFDPAGASSYDGVQRISILLKSVILGCEVMSAVNCCHYKMLSGTWLLQ